MPSVFLSYASEDRQSVQAIRDALPGLGLDVWYDESALGGGEAWDQKIRKQIRECDFFMPIISARTEARAEGYFRREWRFAVERTLDMADDHVFLVPIVIDDTISETARVPERFLSVQWMRLPDGSPTPPFEALCRRLATGQTAEAVPPSSRRPPPANRPPSAHPGGTGAATTGATTTGAATAGTATAGTNDADASTRAGRSGRSNRKARDESPPPDYPEFPRQEPGQNARFYGQTAVWTLQSAWVTFNRLPKWVRVVAYAWLAVILMSRCNNDSDRPKRASKVDTDKIEKLAEKFEDSADSSEDMSALAAKIARQFPAQLASGQGAGQGGAGQSALLAIPFGAPAGDDHAKSVAGAVFAQLYGRLAIAQHGHVRLQPDPAPPADSSAAAERGRAKHATYVVYGGVEGQSLNVKVVESDDGTEVWSKSYPLDGADSSRIAAEVESKIPPPDSND